MRSRRYTVLVACRTTGAVRRFTISRRLVAAVMAALVALPLGVGLAARWSALEELAALRAANAALEVENSSFRAATTELTSQIAALQSALGDLGEKAAIDPAAARAIERLPALARARATGGAPLGNPGLAAALTSPESTFGLLRDLLLAIETRLEGLRYGVERRRALAAATPSIWPVAGWLSSAFGTRPDPFTGEPTFHAGLDISADRGTPVVATADGTVASAGYQGPYGNLVVIAHAFGLETRYGHLARIAVRPGQAVRRGEIIGFVGSTGRSTSSHLHYEVWLNNRMINPLRLLATRR
ncbi:MAG TPA: M23 family metallopeptidase [Vicinamibacterales bacterium]|nr:M23 family metallopeptidase [Vicinamibacterales bacterium]